MEEESASLLMHTRQLSAGEHMVFLTNQEGQNLKGQLKVVARQLWDGEELAENACLVAERLDLETGQLQALPYTSSGGNGALR